MAESPFARSLTSAFNPLKTVVAHAPIAIAKNTKLVAAYATGLISAPKIWYSAKKPKISKTAVQMPVTTERRNKVRIFLRNSPAMERASSFDVKSSNSGCSSCASSGMISSSSSISVNRLIFSLLNMFFFFFGTYSGTCSI